MRDATVTAGAARDGAMAAATTASVGQQTLFFTMRPWIKVDSIIPETDLRVTRSADGIGARIRLIFVLNNVGRSPAKNVRFHLSTVGESDDVLGYHQKFLADCMAAGREFNSEAYTVFPNDPLKIRQKSIFTETSDDAIRMGSNVPQIFGCITYLFDFSEEVHATTFAMRIYRGTVDSWSGISVPMGKEAEIPRHELAFVPLRQAETAT